MPAPGKAPSTRRECSVAESDAHVRHTRSRRDRQEDRRVSRDRELADGMSQNFLQMASRRWSCRRPLWRRCARVSARQAAGIPARRSRAVMGMLLETGAFAEGGAMPPEFAFGVADPKTHIALSGNINPDFRWTGLPVSTQSWCCSVSIPTCPPRRRREPGGSDRAGVAPARRLLPLGAGRPSAELRVDRAVGSFPSGVTARGKPGRPQACRRQSARQGINDYTGWFAGDKDMAGNYFGYDGPCPPWNDEIPHRYVFTLYALDVPRLAVTGSSAAPIRPALVGHVLEQPRSVRATPILRVTL